ncbi:hypothetical protein EPN44_15930 [bacterium]|nr:MAG: hypothetical protein EPN44_15930 [bacterium]
MADRNLEIALRIKADLESARKQLDELAKSVKATGDNSQASADKIAAVGERIGEMEKEAADANKTLGQTGKVADATAGKTNNLGREVAQLARNLGSGNISGATGNIKNIGVASTISAEGVSVLAAGVWSVVAVLALLAVGAFKGYQESERLRISTIATGDAAGVSAAEYDRMAVSIGEATGRYGDARKAVELLAASGQVAGAGISGLAQQAVNMSIVTGMSIDKAVAKIIEIGERPAQAIAKLNEQYHFLTSAQYAQIAALEAEGNTRAAARLANQLDAQAMAERAQDVQNNAGILERAAHAVKSAWDGAWDSINGIGRAQGLGDQAEAIQKQLDALLQGRQLGKAVIPGVGEDDPRVQTLRKQLADIRRQQYDAGLADVNQSLDARANADAIAARQRTAQFAPAEEKRDNALKQAAADRLAMMYGVVDPAEKARIEAIYTNQVKAANDAYDRATREPKGPRGPRAADNTRQALAAQQDLLKMLQQMQGQLDPTAAAWAKYNATVDQANAKAALAKQAKGANVEAIDAERTAVVQLAATMRDQDIAGLARKDQLAWEQLRNSLRTPAEARLETAAAQIADLNDLLAKGVITANQYNDSIGRVMNQSLTQMPTFQGVDAAVAGPAGELIRVLQYQQGLEKAHTDALQENQRFRDQDQISEARYQQNLLDIKKSYDEQRAAADAAKNKLALDTAAAGFGQLAGAARAAYGEQSKQYRIAFALQKAAALAQSILAIQTSIAESSKIGFPWNIVTIAGAVAQGVSVLATINSTNLGGYATGGEISGPGTGTSDSVLMWGSNGEFMQREAAVKYYGLDFMHAVNNLQLPRFATGGLIGANAPAAPSFRAPAAPQIAANDANGALQNKMRVYVLQNEDQLAQRLAEHPAIEKRIVVVAGENGQAIRAEW